MKKVVVIAIVVVIVAGLASCSAARKSDSSSDLSSEPAVQSESATSDHDISSYATSETIAESSEASSVEAITESIVSSEDTEIEDSASSSSEIGIGVCSQHMEAGVFEFDMPDYWDGRVTVDVISDTEVIIRPDNVGNRGYNYLVRITITDSEGEAKAGGDLSQRMAKSGRLDDETFLTVRCATPQLWYQPGAGVPDYIFGDQTKDQFAELLDLATEGLYTVEDFDDASIEPIGSAPIMEEFAESVIVKDHELIERLY